MSKFLLTNLLFFQIIWFVSAVYQQDGIVVTTLLIIIHFIFSPSKKNDVKVLLLAAIGLCVDQLLLMLNIIGFSNNTTMVPYWFILLWCYFSITFNHSLQWTLQLPIVLQSLLGGIFGTLSYIGALSFNAISTTVSQTAFILYFFITWSILFPLLSVVHKYLFSLSNDYKKEA